MRFLILACALLLAACNPTLNWREVRAEPTTLSLLLPCKPDRGARTVPFAGRDTELTMLGCDAGGATFAVAHAEIADPARAPEVVAQWRAATLANMRGRVTAEQPLPVAGAGAAVPPLRATASGQRANGRAVQSQMAYFAQGRRVYQAVVYADMLASEATDTFFACLRFK